MNDDVLFGIIWFESIHMNAIMCRTTISDVIRYFMDKVLSHYRGLPIQMVQDRSAIFLPGTFCGRWPRSFLGKLGD